MIPQNNEPKSNPVLEIGLMAALLIAGALIGIAYSEWTTESIGGAETGQNSPEK